MYFQYTSAQLLASKDRIQKCFYFIIKVLSSLDIPIYICNLDMLLKIWSSALQEVTCVSIQT